MELVDIESSKIFHLEKVSRPAGQLFLPDAAARLVAKYEFRSFPTLEQLVEPQTYFGFGVGKFNDTQIQDFRIYGDGFTVEARSDSAILDKFVDDFIGWYTAEFGFRTWPSPKPERHHESTLVVRSDKDLNALLSNLNAVAAEMNRLISKENYSPRAFSVSGFVLDADNFQKGSSRKEGKFVIDRKLGHPYEDGLYFSQCPLPTKDHLALLDFVEGLVK
jgi:hypothetical protein